MFCPMFCSSKMTVYPSSKCPTFLAAMDEQPVHTWKCKFVLLAGMDKQSVHSGFHVSLVHNKHGHNNSAPIEQFVVMR